MNWVPTPRSDHFVRVDQMVALRVLPVTGEPELHQLLGWYDVNGPEVVLVEASQAECRKALHRIVGLAE